MKEGEYRHAERPEKGGHHSTAASALAGTGVCGGKVTSRAAVLASLSDAHLLRAGDILVTRQTDPGWAPVFSLIHGLVIERGGMLSHGAIIAREFGLPCVVGVKDAAARIPHGCTVSMDGDRGHVQILD
jgi:pyruvate,water dikinase